MAASIGDSGPYSGEVSPGGPPDTRELAQLIITKVARAGASVIEFSSEPYLSGGQNVGQTLSFAGGTYTMAKPVLSYQWRRNGVAIAGATDASYVAAIADIGKTLSLSVTVSRANLGSSVKVLTAPSITLSDFALQADSDPSVSGTPVVGGTLTANPGTWNAAGLAFSYQWTRNGAPIPGATSPVYTATAADLSEDVAVRVTASKSGYYASAVKDGGTVHIGAGTFATVGSVAISTPAAQFVVGNAISATLTGWAKNATLTYQWEHSPDGTVFETITGATGKTFTATAATAGYTRLTVTAKAPGYTTQVASTTMIRINP